LNGRESNKRADFDIAKERRAPTDQIFKGTALAIRMQQE
jgi:hypothetical protein